MDELLRHASVEKQLTRLATLVESRPTSVIKPGNGNEDDDDDDDDDDHDGD